ncbi:3-alpha,7-alpha,12-alpha-trihydroxy-5-beta-cholest-24-enoyl-CoA hydratase [Bradyrhizobium jicamae]|uniref:MaoC family dehydratase n=1 Tax=Bradyrhizobium jicamae TaxID=280332 RepID=UPI001BA62A6D|nr:MaoC family dehydratase [Bradyrhizobium jicamae]MBR0754417.1 3-alpha,7-alpha,12-alpha-trihydroxy-5-beta-cholest-24-enoyl-CoA hydratase [Bradyrhizobium jicamae]
MPLEYTRLITTPFSDQVRTYAVRDAMLYALSVGLGSDPLDPRQLAYVYERNLRAFPSMAHVLGMEIDWLFDPANGIDLAHMLHIESGLTQVRPLPAEGSVKSRMAIKEILDRGVEKGAVLSFERSLRDAKTDDLLAIVTGKFLLRANGGFGGQTGRALPPAEIPEREPDFLCELPTLPQSALLYRLNNDPNPLHADPEVARQAGFSRPILHGACTYAVACHAFIRTITGYDGAKLRRFDVRFSAPVLPGDTIRTAFWKLDDNRYAFTAHAIERDVLVLTNGLAEHC